ncbi:hypothetical protein DL764_006899 [Monosporascus ibericus]|uniref:WSC domain-containing protein n=1 Tax=Monosporascus ibericus TaxID=155417 RepID=A0A4Q4T5T7_9PEZI|nr:hypothetical protein DL764_006899 [Monosporascus ibericus]
MPISISDFDAKRFCLRSLLWSGLLFLGSRNEVTTSSDPLVGTEAPLMLGSPTVRYATRTVTVTIAYKPTLMPGDAIYTLLGCYGESSTRHAFGQEGQYAVPGETPAENLTIMTCFQGCAGLKPPSGSLGQYAYVGIQNGSECFCASHLVPEAPKLSEDNCRVPCASDARLSCGGTDAVVLYNLIGIESKKSTDAEANGTSTKGGKHDDAKKDKENELMKNVSSTISASEPPATRDTSRKTMAGPALSGPSITETGAAAGLDDANAELGQEGQGQGPWRKTVAAVVGGSMSGAFVLVALLFFCIRAYKRRRTEQDAHVSSMLDMQQEKQKADKERMIASILHHKKSPPALVLDDSHRDVRLTVDGTLVPTTPALESGGGGVRGRRPSAADDSLFRALMGQTQTQTDSKGQSSGAQWRGGGGGGPTVPPSPRVPFGNSGSGPGGAWAIALAAESGGAPSPARPEHAARPSANLGDRAWHRRKMSTQFPPQGSPGPAHSLHTPRPHPHAPSLLPPRPLPKQNNNGHGHSVTSTGPPSGPPTAPLPPTPPVRPRRSFDTLDLGRTRGSIVHGVKHGGGGGEVTPPPPGAYSHHHHYRQREKYNGGSGFYTNAAASASTPSLSSLISPHGYGYGCRDRTPRDGFAPTAPLRVWRQGVQQEGEDGSAAVPAQPPNARGEAPDPWRWRGTIYAAAAEGRDHNGGESGTQISPKSVTTIRTSILDSPTIGQWAQR